jgi:drug/metabolite transporter (DMT)-like permease
MTDRSFVVRGAPSRLAAVCAVAGAVLIWSTSFVVTKLAYASIPPMTVAALRFLVALVPLAVVYLADPRRERPSPRDLRIMRVGGLLGITAYFATENYGLGLATATDAALVVGAFPAIAILLEALVHRVRPTWPKAVGVLAATLGVAFIVSGHPEGASAQRPLGLALMLLSGVAWAFYNFETRTVARTYSMATLMFHQTAAGLLGLLPLAALELPRWRAVPAGAWLGIVYLGLLCSLVGYVLYAYGLRTLPSSSAVTLLNLIPVFGVAFSVLVLWEKVLASQLAGGAIVLGGVALALRQPERAPAGIARAAAGAAGGTDRDERVRRSA